MKIIKLGASGKMVQIGDDPQNSQWYVITDTVAQYIKDIKEGEDVTIRFEKVNGKNHLSFIQRGNGAVSPANTGNRVGRYTRTPYQSQKDQSPATATTAYPAAKSYGKSAEEQDSIKRQATLHAMSRALIALQGQVNPETIYEESEKLYDHFWNLVNKPIN